MGTYTLTIGAELIVNKSLTLTGAGSGDTIIQAATSSADATSRVLNITASGDNVAIFGVTIRNGKATYGGGVLNNGMLTLTSATLTDNSAVVAGGGIWNIFGTLTLTNSTVSGNSADFGGGGIYNEEGTLALANSTVSDNSATTGGGILNAGTADLTNTIIAGNTAANGPDCSGVPTSLGHNLIGTSDGCNFTLATGDLININPMLGPLQDNGGPTFTHALLSGSPAIDAGDDSVLGPPHNLTTDQRGFPRLQGAHVDIGAYEACGLPAGLVTVGWTLIGWACDSPGDPAAISAALGGTVRIYGYDPAVPANPWKIYDSAAPPFVNTLQALTKWNGYWVYYETGPIEPAPGIVSWWPGDGTAFDIVGSNHGTLQGGVTYTGGMVGQAFSLDGVGDHVQLTTAPALEWTGDFTVDAWIMVTNYSGGDEAVLGMDHDDPFSSNNALHLNLRGEKPYFGFQNNDTPGNTVLSTNTWYHITWRYTQSGGEQAIFVNGELDASSLGHAAFQGTGNVFIGRSHGSNYFDGLIDEVEVFNRAVTDAEVKAIYDAGSAGKRKP